MSETNVWIDDNDPPQQPGLPRLQIIHLMMWMAATATAFLPFQLRDDSLAQTERAESASSDNRDAIQTAIGVVGGVCNGALLFISVAAIVWSLRGYLFRFAPGHILAFTTTIHWLSGVPVWFFAREDFTSSKFHGIQLVWSAISVVLFAWYLAIAVSGKESRGWRLAFGATAMAELCGVAGQQLGYLMGSLLHDVLPGIAVAAALVTDRRRQPTRHWSHWVAGVALVVRAATQAVFYAWIITTMLA